MYRYSVIWNTAAAAATTTTTTTTVTEFTLPYNVCSVMCSVCFGLSVVDVHNCCCGVFITFIPVSVCVSRLLKKTVSGF